MNLWLPSLSSANLWRLRPFASGARVFGRRLYHPRYGPLRGTATIRVFPVPPGTSRMPALWHRFFPSRWREHTGYREL